MISRGEIWNFTSIPRSGFDKGRGFVIDFANLRRTILHQPAAITACFGSYDLFIMVTIVSQIKIWASRSGIEASAGFMVNENNRLKPRIQKIIWTAIEVGRIRIL